MSKGKDPAVLFYTSDFLTGVSGLTMEERGQYITLLCFQHQQGPLSEKQIRLSVGVISDDVRAKFKVNSEGLLFNERMLLESEKRKAYTVSRQINGSHGGRPPKTSENHMDNHMDNHMGNHSENENINRNINISISNNRGTNIGECSKSPQMTKKCTSNEVLFDRFWEAYPKKKAKVEARKRWDKLKVTDALAQTMLDAIAEQKKSADWTREAGRFIPYPATWLNQGRWLDELSASEPNTAAPPRFSDFDPNEAMRCALERSYSDD